MARDVWRIRRLVVRVAAAVAQNRPYRLVDALYDELPPDLCRIAAARVLSKEARIVEIERSGTRWRTDTGPGVGEQLIAHGSFEQWKEAAVIRWLGESRGTVLDIGANVGTTTVAFAAAGYDVVAVEAIPSTFEMLRWNVERNGYSDRVICLNVAVAEQDVVEMWAATISGHGEVVGSGPPPGPSERIAVRGVGLDEVAPGATPILVWVDVQGAETGALRTGRELWATGVPVFCEVDPAKLDAHGGREAFAAEATHSFSSFTPVDDLRQGGPARPISELTAWMRAIDVYSDALFGHQTAP